MADRPTSDATTNSPMAHWPEREPATLPRAVPIDRREKLSPLETMQRYLLPGEGTPVVVTDAQENWKAP